MIKVSCIEDNGLLKPSELVDLSKVTSSHCDGVNFYYFEGDEPENLNDIRLDDNITPSEVKEGWTQSLINYFKKLFS